MKRSVALRASMFRDPRLMLKRAFPREAWLLRFFCAWCAGAVVCRLVVGAPFTSLASYASVSVFPLLSGAFCMTAALAALSYRGYFADRTVLPVLLFLYHMLLLRDDKSPVFCLCFSVLWAILFFHYARAGWLARLRAPKKSLRVGIAAAALVGFLLVVGGEGILRYRTFVSPNFDFGIFCQSFYSLRTRGVPLTTCERDGLLSHFAVHLSPALYLLLPVYWLIPRPETLQLAQTLLLAAAAIPVWKLSNRLGYSRSMSLVFCVLWLCYPAVACGTDYDFHENCFLPLFLLCMFYMYESKRPRLCILFAGLTLAVKEDAFVYVAFFALYVFFEAKSRKLAAGLFGLSVLWFLAALGILSAFGEGVMTSRYDNFIAADGGLGEAVLNVFKDPGYVFTQTLADPNGVSVEKLLFILQMLAPLAFAPLVCVKTRRTILLLPILLVNLMTFYKYQYDIHFQYAFGAAAFLFYLALLQARELSARTRKATVCTALIIAFSLFVSGPTAKTAGYLKDYAQRRADYQIMEAYLSDIPKERGVVCSTFLLPHCAARDVVYEDHYHTPVNGDGADLVIVDLTREHEAEAEKFRAFGYRKETYVSNGDRRLLLIMEKE